MIFKYHNHDTRKFKLDKCLVLLSFLYCYSCLANIEEINTKSDYAINFETKKIYTYTNDTKNSVLIKVHQNYDVNVKIYNNKKSTIVNTPGHKVIPEFFIVNPGEQIRFSIIPQFKNQSKVMVNFEIHILDNKNLQIWSRLFDTILLFSKGDIATAAMDFNVLADELKDSNNKLMYEVYFMSAVSFYDAQNYDKALKLLELIITSKTKLPVLLKANTLNYKARTFSIKGYKLRAIEIFTQSSKLFSQIKEVKGYASSLNNIGLSYHLLGKLNLAKKYYDEALTAYKSINDIKAVANQYINIGGVYFMRGLNSQAKENYDLAISLSKKINDTSVEADALEMFAWLQQSQGDFAGLLLKWNEILKIRKALEDESGITRAYRLIGQSYLSYGNDSKALQFLNKSLERARKVTLTENYPVTLNNIAQAYFNLGDIDSSKLFYQQALDYNLEVKNEFYSAKDYLGLARTKLGKVQNINQNDFNLNVTTNQVLKKSLSLTNSAIAIYNNSQNKLNLIKALVVKAEVFYLMNDNVKALMQVEETRRISQNINDFSSLIEIDFIHGKILLSMHKETQAIKLFKSVLQKSNVKRHQIINPKYRATFVASLDNCRNLLIETLISESTRYNDKSLVLEALMISESGKARSLNDLMHQTKSKTIGDNKYIALQNQLQTLYYLKSDLQDKPHFKEIEVSRINHEIQEVLFKLDVLQESNGYGQSKKEINKNRIKQLQETMDDKSLFVALRLTSKQSFIWHISKDEITVKALPQKELIENNIRALYEFFKASPYGLKRFPLKINQRLAWMVDKVFFDVDFNNIEKLVISPHGAVQLFPVNLLYYSNRKLSPRLKISYTPSLMMEKRRDNTIKHSSKLLVMADPHFSNAIELVESKNISSFRGNSFEELKFTIDEAKHIVNLYGESNVDLLVGSQLTKEKVLSKIQNQYEILHFATHGLIDTEIPEMSGLVFSSNGNIDNNILTIGEIMNLQIQSNTVVLSACETAIGENVREEGLIGLSYAFLAAGANHVYATLWKIGDKSALYSIKKMYSGNYLDSTHLITKDPFWVKYEIL